MAFSRTHTNAAGTKFFDNAHLLKELDGFENEVRADPSKFQAGILQRFHKQFVAYGIQQLNNMHRALMTRDFPNGHVPADISGLLTAMRDRYTGLWEQNVNNAFATAMAEAAPQRRSIISRIFAFFEAEPEKFTAPKKVKRQGLTGVVRTANVQGKRRLYRNKLSVQMKLLFRTYPMNLMREHDILLAKWKSKGGEGEEVFFISAGRSKNSSPVCVLCQGRALTKTALRMVTTQFQSNLFHPNCRHRFSTEAAMTESTYDQSRGPLVTVNTVAKWLSSGKIKKARRPRPSVINI